MSRWSARRSPRCRDRLGGGNAKLSWWSGMAAEFRLLSEVEARLDGRVVDIGHARQRCVLATLLVEANRPVSADRLLDRVWGERLPQRARATLHGYLSRLRQALTGTDQLGPVRQPAGYVVTVDPMAVDLHRFQHLVGQARSTGDADRAEALYREALALWRGDALAAVDSPWLNDLRVTLHRQRLAAELDRNDLVMRRGRHVEVLDDMSGSAVVHPLDERLCGQLMLALYRCGRQAEALDLYQRLRLRLAEELGADPGPPLRRLHRQILTGDPALVLPPAGAGVPGAGAGAGVGVAGAGAGVGGAGAARARAAGGTVPEAATGGTVPEAATGGTVPEAATGSVVPGTAAAAVPVPRQLPPPPSSFTGRGRELVELDRAMDGRPGRSDTVVISAIGGLGGMGKTWLAVRWAYDNLDRFPDGQLYVNLHGFDPASEPVPPAVAVRSFLDALGAPAAAIPADPEAQAGLYRSLVAGRRMLIVLDNARDTGQVIPLLPGAATCAVLVTSRHRLAGLLTAYGARPLALDVLAECEARQLLTDQLGAERVAAEPAPVDALVRHCAGLPLALGIVAARAAMQPAFPLARLAEELRAAATRLDALDAGELAVNLRAVLACSYRALAPDAARVFQLLGLTPGPDVGLAAVASLVALPIGRTRVLLRELTSAHLLQEHVPDRYRTHDLVRLFATERISVEQPEEDRQAARRRMLDHYLHTAHAAARLLDPHREPVAPAAPQPGVVPERLAGHGPALAWFADEQAVLLAAVRQTAGLGFDTHIWQLAWTLTTFLDRRGQWDLQVVVHQAALEATGRLADRPGQAHAHRFLARAYLHLGRYAEAHQHLRRALELFSELGDQVGQAYTHHVLARVFERLGRYSEALDHARRTLELHRVTGHPSGQANALNTVGWFHSLLGDHQRAIGCCEPALNQLRGIGDRHGQATTWDSLGYAHHHLGHHRQAIACYQRALDLFRELGARYQQADTLIKLGDAEHAGGDPDRAGHAWRQALDLLHHLHHPDADRVRAKLHHPDADRVRAKLHHPDADRVRAALHHPDGLRRPEEKVSVPASPRPAAGP